MLSLFAGFVILSVVGRFIAGIATGIKAAIDKSKAARDEAAREAADKEERHSALIERAETMERLVRSRKLAGPANKVRRAAARNEADRLRESAQEFAS